MSSDQISHSRHWFAQIPEALIDDHEVSGDALRLYARLDRYAGHSDDSDGTCWPGIETLAEALGWSDATVKRRLVELIQAGWVKRRRRLNRSWVTYVCAMKNECAPWEERFSDHSASISSDMSPPVSSPGEPSISSPGDPTKEPELEEVELENPRVRMRVDPEKCPLDQVCAVWPRPGQRPNDVRESWRLAMARCSPTDMAIAVSAFVNAWDVPGADPKWCMGLDTWLRRRRYEDGLDQEGPNPPEPPGLPPTGGPETGPTHPLDVSMFDEQDQPIPDDVLDQMREDAAVAWEAFHGREVSWPGRRRK